MPSFELPRGSEIPPERKPPEIYAKSLLVQSAIVSRLREESDRHRWIEENGGLFREMLESDETFRKLVLEEDVDGVLAAMEKRKAH